MRSLRARIRNLPAQTANQRIPSAIIKGNVISAEPAREAAGAAAAETAAAAKDAPVKRDRRNPMHEGHRQRLTERCLKEGLEGFEEHEILEYLLFYVLPRVDTNPIAHRLIETFGSLAGVLEAKPEDLEQIEGIGPRAAAFISIIPEVFRAYERSKLGKRPYIKTIKDACDLAKSLLFGKPYEQFYVIWLDTQNRVIHYERLSEGSVSESPVYLNKIAAAALRHRAVKVIIAHNHPGGNVTPSKADISTTHDILKTLNILSIDLIDHIIVSENSAFSFQADSLMGKRSFKNKDAYTAEYTVVKELVPELSEYLMQ